jgi:hypothetical protein
MTALLENGLAVFHFDLPDKEKASCATDHSVPLQAEDGPKIFVQRFCGEES